MMKKTLQLVLLAVMLAALFASCAPGKEKEKQPRAAALTYADFINTGKRIAVQLGDVYGDVGRDI